MKFAAGKHRNQRRKNAEATPYINHPIELVELLINQAGIKDVKVLVAALLHDTVEDTETTEEELRENFGDDITNIVLEVSDDKSLQKEDRKRKQIENAATCSDEAKLVKLADKICNLRDMTISPPANWSLERKRQYFDWANDVIQQLRGVNSKLEQLFDETYYKKP